jgi:hypothetical protein
LDILYRHLIVSLIGEKPPWSERKYAQYDKDGQHHQPPALVNPSLFSFSNNLRAPGISHRQLPHHRQA